MLKHTTLFTLWLGLAFLFVLNAQTTNHTFLVSAGNNSVALIPTTKPLHPSFQVGYEKVWKDKKFSLVQNFRVGYYYQRLVHHAVPIYTQIGYRYKTKIGLQIATYLDAGYLHTFSAIDVYKLNSNGEYEQTARAGRAHAMFGLSSILSYPIKGNKISFTPFVHYQFFMITPFVKNYVPLLPNTSLNIGTYFTINRPAK